MGGQRLVASSIFRGQAYYDCDKSGSSNLTELTPGNKPRRNLGKGTTNGISKSSLRETGRKESAIMSHYKVYVITGERGSGCFVSGSPART